MHIAIVFTRLQRLRIFNSLIEPVFFLGAPRSAMLPEDPHHPWQESVAPMRPRRSFMLPAPALSVNRIVSRVALDQASDLLLANLQGCLKYVVVIFRLELNHGF